MSDSFADLWSSTAPSKPQPQKLGAASTTQGPRRPQQDVFALLSSTGPSNASSRSITPALQKSTTPKPAPSIDGGDAFSGLLSGSLAASNNTRMTIAERAAQAERQKLEILRRQPTTVHTQDSSGTWAGLDSLETGFPSIAPSVTSSNTDNLLGDDDDWGFGIAPVTKSQHVSLPPERTNSPGDFDFGNRENALLDDDSDEEGNILGELSKPVDSITKRPAPSNQYHSSSSNATSHRTIANGPTSRPVSPPPHILGKIVEMGFSVQQARVALASTDTGLDVEAALDTLLANDAGSSSLPPPSSIYPQSPEVDAPPPRSATGLMGALARDGDREREMGSMPQQDKERNIQEQTDKLLAQASEIGLSVLNKASLFWKEGKGRVQKAYEERAAGGSQSGRDGKPKWMQGAAARRDTDDDDGWRDQDGDRENGFSDDVLPPRPSRTSTVPKRGVADVQAQPQAFQDISVDLFSTDEPAAYVSPFRRAKPTPQPSPPPHPQLPPRTRTQTQAKTRTSPSSLIRPTLRRNLVSAPSSIIARSAQHKSLGSSKFKLGQYADAESAYTTGIACLPPGHLLLVPLYNNRALTRLRTGDYAGAVEDAGRVVEIVGEGYYPESEEVVRGEEYVGLEGGVDLGEGLVKALKRRAEAWEGRERWPEAGKDWEALAGKEWVKPGVKGEAVRGAGRCRRMVVQAQEGGNGRRVEDSELRPTPKPKPKPKPKVRPAGVVSNGPSQALENLRNVSDAAEREDQARHDLKDVVDAKLGAWKGGKEANIRALLGSLDMVLWPELGLKKPGLADLVSEKQVKVQYTRTIARLHPDKLNASNTTVEQRMIATAVFGALNEAWNAVKP